MKNLLKLFFNISLYCFLAAFILAGCQKEEPKPEPEPNQETTSCLLGILEEREMSADAVKQACQQMAGETANLSMLNIPWHPIRVVTLKYRTTNASGQPVEASGIVAYRTDMEGGFRGIYSVQHGTCEFTACPSKLAFSPEACACLLGHIAVEADYIGYGHSETANHAHPYLHSESTAQACYDMLCAAKEYLKKCQISYTDTTHLVGYSQGGAATIALLKKLEEKNYPTIGEVFAGGGPLSLTITFNELLKDSVSITNYQQPAYMLLIFRSMNECHHLQLDWSKLFKPKYADAIGLLDTLSFAEANKVLGNNFREIITEDFFAPDPTAINSEIAKLYDAFAKNDLILNFSPKHKATLFHSPTDDIVPYSNSKTAADKYPNYTLANLSSKTHFAGAVEFLLWLLLVHK